MNAISRFPTSFVPLTPQLRARIEKTVEELLAILDAFDGDADFERDDGDGQEDDAGDDRETDADFEPSEDDEPDLGWSVVASGGEGFRKHDGRPLRISDEFDFDGGSGEAPAPPRGETAFWRAYDRNART